MKRQDTAKKTFAIRIADKSTQAEKQKNLKAIAKGHNIKINHLKTHLETTPMHNWHWKRCLKSTIKKSKMKPQRKTTENLLNGENMEQLVDLYVGIITWEQLASFL